MMPETLELNPRPLKLAVLRHAATYLKALHPKPRIPFERFRLLCSCEDEDAQVFESVNEKCSRNELKS